MSDKKKINGSLALNAQKVIVIGATEQQDAQKLHVAAYARVSTDSTDQANSFLAQMEHYNRVITSNERWTMVDVYADRGITGRSASKRPDFQRMLADCRMGKIDKILVKSISRFARNTKECLEIVRELKAIGVAVCFEEQNIDTGRVTGELLTSVFAAIAQKESESISQNIRWSYQRRMEGGTFLPSSMAYGYRIEDKKIAVDTAKAGIVRRIFDEYLNGRGIYEITNRLNADRIVFDDSNPERKWTVSSVSYILSNERYIGDSLWQKKYSTEEFPPKKVRNHGERQQYYAAGTQEAIIDKETFDAVNQLRKRRVEQRHDSPEKAADAFRSRLRCGECGTFRKYNGDKVYLVCRKHYHNKDSCPLGQVPESVLHEAFLRLYHKLKWHGDEILAPMVKDLRRIRRRKLLWSEDVVALNKQISEISEQNQLLASMNQMGLVDPDLYIARSNEYGRQLREAKRKRAKLLDEDGGDDAIDKTEDLLDTLETMPDFLPRFDESVFVELVERMELTADHRLIFHLYNGLALTECVDRRERP